MKKVFKKNQVIITALAIMIAIAGYLNFADVDFGLETASTETSDNILEEMDSLEYDISDETALLEENSQAENAAEDEKDDTQTTEDAEEAEEAEEEETSGEIVDVATAEEGMEDMVTDTPGEAVLTGSSNFSAQAKISREQIRSQNKSNLMEIIDNPDISDEQKQAAIASMVEMSELMEKEAAAELLLEAKGFTNVVVNLTGTTADVVLPDAQIEDTQRAQIEDIVKRKTEIAPEQIIITPLSQAE